MNVAQWARRQRNLLEAQVKLMPHDAGRWHALAQAELTLGNLRRGFELFEARLQDTDIAGTSWAPAGPRWLGQPVNAGFDGTLYVQPEQGLGDQIMMARYLPLCKERWAQVVCEVRPPLYRLFHENFGDMVIPLRAESISYDFAVPVLSLPMVFHATIPKAPYLTSRFRKDAPFWTSAHGKVIGIAWAGAARHRNDQARSIPEAVLIPLLASDFGPWVSLQVDRPPMPRMVDLRAYIQDVADTARFVAGLSLVITCDSMVAHLAGALGVPCWVLLPYVPDWRWQLDRSDSPWYPSVRLFRQKRPGDWADVITRVLHALERRDTAPVSVGITER